MHNWLNLVRQNSFYKKKINLCELEIFVDIYAHNRFNFLHTISQLNCFLKNYLKNNCWHKAETLIRKAQLLHNLMVTEFAIKLSRKIIDSNPFFLKITIYFTFLSFI